MDRTDASPLGEGDQLSPELPDDTGPELTAASEDEAPSLMSDLDALIADGKTYIAAEVAFQKSRAGFAAGRLKSTAIYGAGAFAFLHLALIALAVGLVIALTPLVGAWIATGIVVALLLLGAFLFVRKLRGQLREIRAVFEDGEP